MRIETEAVVIGSGMAGISAAMALLKNNHRVIVISRAHGSTALSSGVCEIVPDSGFSRLEGALKEGLAYLLPKFHEAGVRMEVVEEGVALLLTQAGKSKFVRMAHPSLMAGNLTRMKDARITLVGIEGLPEYDIEYISQKLPQLILTGNISEVKTCRISLWKKVYNAMACASLLDEEPKALDNLVQALKPVIEAHHPTHLAFPPILGLSPDCPLSTELARVLDTGVFEFIPTTPSPIGVRFYRALQKILKQAGGISISGNVGTIKRDGRLLESLFFQGREGKGEIAAHVFILAGGKFLGGGIIADPELKEPILDLPLFVKENFVSGIPSTRLLYNEIEFPQPLFEAGVKVNAKMQPLDRAKEIIYDNLFCAGAILSGIRYRGLGQAMATGFAAGSAASRLLAGEG